MYFVLKLCMFSVLSIVSHATSGSLFTESAVQRLAAYEGITRYYSYTSSVCCTATSPCAPAIPYTFQVSSMSYSYTSDQIVVFYSTHDRLIRYSSAICP